MEGAVCGPFVFFYMLFPSKLLNQDKTRSAQNAFRTHAYGSCEMFFFPPPHDICQQNKCTKLSFVHISQIHTNIFFPPDTNYSEAAGRTDSSSFHLFFFFHNHTRLPWRPATFSPVGFLCNGSIISGGFSQHFCQTQGNKGHYFSMFFHLPSGVSALLFVLHHNFVFN